MSIPITNAADFPLTANSGTLPNMESAMLDYFQPMTFETIVKTVVGFDVVETPTDVDFQGVWQPLSAQALMMKPEGQRAWKWFQVHAQVGLALKPDEVIKYQGVQYRVMARWDFAIYGYNLFHLCEDYSGAGP